MPFTAHGQRRPTRWRPGPTPPRSPSRSSPSRCSADRSLTAAFGQTSSSPTRSSASTACPSQPDTFYAAELALRLRPGHERRRGPGRTLAEYIGKELKGRPAQYAGESDSQDPDPQVRADLHLDRPGRRDADRRTSRPAWPSTASTCDQGSPTSHPTKLQTDAPGPHRQAQGGGGHLGDLQSATRWRPGPLTTAATGQDYFPEWIITGSPADRHDHLRPHLRPEAVVARLRRDHRCAARTDPSVSGGALPVPLVLRQEPAGHDRRGGHRAADFSLLFSVLQGIGPEPDRPDLPATRCSPVRRPRAP